MPRYRFSWDPFSDATVQALAAHLGFTGDRAGAREWISRKVRRPSDEFVRETKDVLCRTWLLEYKGAEEIVEHLLESNIGPGGAPRSASGWANYIAKCRNAPTLRDLILQSMLRFGDQDRGQNEGVIDGVRAPRFTTLATADQPEDARRPHVHQSEAWDRLSKALAESESGGTFEGLVVMPTGSGKTFTAVRWLAANVLSRGMRVLWVAHRHELLEQAATEFYRAARLVRGVEKLRVRLVSSRHCTVTSVDPSDHVVLAMVPSLSKNTGFIESLLTDGKTMLVVDEAHHAAAKTYRDILQIQRRSRRRYLLGLTATPSRTIDDEKALLSRLFGNKVLYQVEMPELVERGLLSRPRPVPVTTQTNVEAGVTSDDLEHFQRFDDLSEEWLDRIAHMEQRNEIIVRHYLENRAKYGKTIVFAINVMHAALLSRRLQEAGVRADYVASYRFGNEGLDERELASDNRSLIQALRKGDLDVLVNVQLLTEGVDIPEVQAVFLTRPTNSEILMRQMVGRALRGPAAGGTADAYLVSFEDHWERFTEWQHALELIPDIVSPIVETQPASEGEPGGESVGERLFEMLPWDAIKATADAIRARGLAFAADAFEAVPHGWYALEYSVEEVEIRHIVHVYEHQQPCWEMMLDQLEVASATTLESLTAEHCYAEYFADCDLPAPSLHNVGCMLEFVKATRSRPEFHGLAQRRLADPHEVAKELLSRDLGIRAADELVQQRYGALARAIYPNRRDFKQAVEDALDELQHPGEATSMPKAVPVFRPRPTELLRQPAIGTHAHDLPALMQEVLEAGVALAGAEGQLPFSAELVWTGRLVKGWYGYANWQDTDAMGGGRIRINRLLDSPDVSADTMRYLLWHEYLHLYLKQGHTATFKELERRWPTYHEGCKELDTLNERFGIQYW